MNIEQLKKLANLDFTNFIQSENNVKYKVVIPFLQAFNHVDLDLEHAAQGSRIDINIGNRIIVETKALGQNINMHVQQLAEYCGKEFPVLAILTNGRHFRIYSPQWRQLRAFTEKIIYEFELKDLSDINLINRLEKILDVSNYDNLKFFDHIDQREKEILKIKSQIVELKSLKKSEVSEVKNEIDELKGQILELNEQIKLKEKFVHEIEIGNIPELESIASDYLIPFLITKPEISFPKSTGSTNFSTASTVNSTKKVGQRLVINSPKNGVLAFGYLLENDEFFVEKGSTISFDTAPKFQTSARKAYELRESFLRQGIINSQRLFVADKTFNSISQAASVIMGDSKNGNKEWIPLP
jgi:predicted type IV restriction endonuclease